MAEKINQINKKIIRSETTLEDAEFLIVNNKLSITVNRIYYSIFYIISALALQNDFVTSQHSQLIGWFNKNFILTNRISVNTGKIVHNMFEQRSKADYDDYITFDKNEVLLMYKDAQLLINQIKEIISIKQV